MNLLEFLGQFVILILLLSASAFFAASETAIFSLSAVERRRMGRLPYKTSEVIRYLFENPRRTLVAIILGNNLANILFTALATSLTYHAFGVRGVGIAIALVTLILIVFGDIVPKTIAVNHNEFLARLTAWPLHIFAQLMFPLRILVRRLTDLLLSLLIKERTRGGESLSEKELQALIEIGEEEGILDRAEGKRLGRLFELSDRSVKEIMTPRTDLVAFEIGKDRGDLYRLLQNYHYTYVPVYSGSPDRILGVVPVQEALLNPEKDIRSLLREPYYIPETKKIDELLFEMRKTKIPFAICVDEFGGTSGLVTQEDIVEEVFGEIYDEYAKEEKLIKRLGRDDFLIHGKISLKELNESLGTHFRSETSETLSGFIFEKLGRIPKPKETLRAGDYVFEIKEMEKRRIQLVELRKLR